MKDGDKYLSISVWGNRSVPVWPNEKYSKQTDPSYIGNGFAVWVNTYRKKEEKEVPEWPKIPEV